MMPCMRTSRASRSTSDAARPLFSSRKSREWPENVVGRGVSSPKACVFDGFRGYRNSPVMHPSVSLKCKPLLFRDGEQIPFPPPTQARFLAFR